MLLPIGTSFTVFFLPGDRRVVRWMMGLYEEVVREGSVGEGEGEYS
jgi:hypothetical protein